MRKALLQRLHAASPAFIGLRHEEAVVDDSVILDAPHRSGENLRCFMLAQVNLDFAGASVWERLLAYGLKAMQRQFDHLHRVDELRAVRENREPRRAADRIALMAAQRTGSLGS